MWILIAGAAAVVVVVLLVMMVGRARTRRRTARLRARFGPEYDTAVDRYGRVEGERLLEERLREHRSRRLRDVTPEEREAAIRSWNAVQASFVDSPATAVHAADQLVYDVLRDRGYPLESVDARASALSVDDPHLAHRYRRAHAELARAEATDGGADVGRLRDALLAYRDLLQELVGVPSLEGRLTTGADDGGAPAGGGIPAGGGTATPGAERAGGRELPDHDGRAGPRGERTGAADGQIRGAGHDGAGDDGAGDDGAGHDQVASQTENRTNEEESAWTSTPTDRI